MNLEPELQRKVFPDLQHQIQNSKLRKALEELEKRRECDIARVRAAAQQELAIVQRDKERMIADFDQRLRQVEEDHLHSTPTGIKLSAVREQIKDLEKELAEAQKEVNRALKKLEIVYRVNKKKLVQESRRKKANAKMVPELESEADETEVDD